MLINVLTAVVSAAALLAAAPVAVLALQVMLAHGARVPPQRSRAWRGADVTVALLVPAHDEAGGIEVTLRNLQRELREGDRLLVVADNCTDDTAAVARATGAEVVERFDNERRGKGYALDFGVRHLSARPPSVVVIVDADCRLDPGSVDALANVCVATGRPAQALDEMNAPAGASLRARVSAFAWRVRNRVRPMGYWRIGAPCQLMGTGMALPWGLLHDAPLASSNIVEDVQLGVDLALRGHPPVFVPEARVSSEFPASESAAASQRRRWEHGNLGVMFVHGPRLLMAGLRRLDWRLTALGADLMVPPLALLVQVHLALLGVAALAWSMGAWPLPVCIAGSSFAVLASCIFVARHLAGRDVISLSELLVTAPSYALRKLPMYVSFLWNRESTWVRAKREGD